MNQFARSNELPHLMQLLRRAYAESLGFEEMDPNALNGKSADEFLAFSADYLDKHRTVENWPADSNIGVRLSNNRRALIHPATAAGTGQMQDSGSVAVTEGQTQPGQEGVVPVTDHQKVI